MGQINVIRASAGSGKTHFLTGFFLRQLFSRNSPDYFRHILAVTFTNKATEEMKVRLINELHRLASNQSSNYIGLLCTSSQSEVEVRKKAALLLKKILHDYSWLSVETIDSFFQRVIRAFTRELGIPGNYGIELDVQQVLDYAVDNLIDGLGDDPYLLSWLFQFTEDKIQEGKSWDFRSDLLELGYELFKESFSGHADLLTEMISDREKMKSFRDDLFSIKNTFENTCKSIGKEGLDAIESRGLDDADFYSKKNGAIKIFRMLASVNLTNSSGEPFTRLKVMEKLEEDPQNWPSSDTARKEEVIRLATETLSPLLSRAVQLMNDKYTAYCTALTLIQNLYALGILVDLSKMIRQYRFEKNSFILSDAPLLIERLINHNDTPFIYEKMGNRYSNFLIDEFQDTSGMQWNNFKPLISNALSQGNDCLVVGDVKQSIYRWRNGNWEILARQIAEEYPPETINQRVLDSNWRSAERVVKFNSALFSEASTCLVNQLESAFSQGGIDFHAELNLLSAIYSDVQQKTPELHSNSGDVQLKFFTKTLARENKEYYHEELISSINKLLDRGYALGDIAILVREKTRGKELADFLIKCMSEGRFNRPVRIISDESLVLTVSPGIKVLIAALRYLNSPMEKIYLAELLSALHLEKTETEQATPDILFNWKTGAIEKETLVHLLPEKFLENSDSLSTLPLYELVERLIEILELNHAAENLPYLHAFLDIVHEYVQQEQVSIKAFLDFWETKGSKKAIPASENQDAIRILTIHKSKGLEYRAVIIPFCNWDLNQKTNSTFWVTMPEAFKESLPVFPVNFTKGLKDTAFARDYYQEMYRSYVDNLNLLYVAFTRAKETLVAFPVYGDKSKGKIDTVGDLVYEIISNPGSENLQEHFDAQTEMFTLGDVEKSIVGEETSNQAENFILPSVGSSAMDRLFFNQEGLHYFNEVDSMVPDQKLRGKVLHTILADIETADQLDEYIAQAVLTGAITQREGDNFKTHLIACIQHEQAQKWFDGSGMVRNESDILLSNGKVKRPDRVILYKNSVHVVDYKFGSHTEEEKHRRQVNEYVNLLGKMGYTDVKGFLWYIDMNEVIAV